MSEIHFHSGDERSCDARYQFRQFTTEPNEVTCPRCKARDGFVLSPEAMEYVRQVEAAS